MIVTPILRSLAGAFILLLVTSACTRSGSGTRDISGDQSTDSLPAPISFDLDKIRERGTLRAIVDNSSTSYFLYKGQPMGFEYELLELYAKELGVELKLVVISDIDEALRKLNSGEGDLLAFSFTVTKERKKLIKFTDPHYTVRQVLIQRKPAGWQQMKLHEIEKGLLRNQVDLIGKEIHARKSSSYVDRLRNLSNEIGGDIVIIEDLENVETETMIKMVANGEIKYTVADEDIAMVNAAYYPEIDINTPLSFPQRIAWGTRLNAPELVSNVNSWLSDLKRKPDFNVIYNRYFKDPRGSLIRISSDYSSLSGEKVSDYDDLIKQRADSLGWDWRLLLSQVYQESRFDPRAKSWAGALGIMQMVPETGRRFGARNLFDPEQNIRAGTAFLKYLDKLWARTVSDSTERIKFVLASYNVGLGHVQDARELAIKYGRDPVKWDENVETFLLNKSKAKYYKDPVVKSGYCRGEEPVNYVRQILNRYEQYIQFIPNDDSQT